MPTRNPKASWPLHATRRQLLQGALAGGLCSVLPVAANAQATVQTPAQVQAADGAFELVTDAEARREAEALRQQPAPPTRSRGMPLPASRLAPALAVITPTDDATVSSPLRLEVRFTPPADARIVPASFRVLYGVLKIDLTERLQSNARLSERGVVIEQARVPQGTHRLLLRVADDKGRLAEQVVVFRVQRRPG